MSRNVILIPMRGAPRILPAAVALRDQLEDLCGGSVVSVLATEWRGDRHEVALALHPQVGTDANANALAGRLLGVPVHGPAVLARRPVQGTPPLGAWNPSDRILVPLETEDARSVLAALGEEIERMHDEPAN